MKTILFLKTETNGLPKGKHKKTTKDNLNCWPNIISLYYKIGKLNLETKKIEIEYSNHSIIKGDFKINKYAQNVHQITNETINDEGKNINDVLSNLNEDFKKFKIRFIVGHNIMFDYNILNAEFIRNDLEIYNEKIQLVDTISYNHDYGYLKLEDLYEKLYNKKFKKSHPRKSLINIIIKCFEKLYS